MEVARAELEGRPPRGRFAKPFLICGALSLLAVALGGWICLANDIPLLLWVRNLAAWLLGALVAYALARGAAAWLFPALLIATAIVLTATLFSPGQLGVHRWIGLGPLSVNGAMLTLPAGLVAMAALGRRGLGWWLVALASLAVLVGQPDASQATAFGVALLWIALNETGGARLRRALLGGGVVLLVGASWLRPDPLQPVPEVEGILQLAWAASPAMAALALASLLLFSLAPGWFSRGGAPDERLAGGALSLYFLISAAMPFIGAFPVPLVGIGVSPVLGAWLGIGALAAQSPIRVQA